MTPALSSRPTAPLTLFLSVAGQGATTWNGRAVPAMNPFPNDVNALYEIVRKAWLPFNVNVTTVFPTAAIPHGKFYAIVIGTAFGNYPGGGQSNIGAINTDANPTSYVFSDRVGYDPVACGWLAAHESGHGMAGFSDDITVTADNPLGIYTPGRIMGNCLASSPIWAPDQRKTLDATFGSTGDLNGDGVVNEADEIELRAGWGTRYGGSDAIAVGRNLKQE